MKNITAQLMLLAVIVTSASAQQASTAQHLLSHQRAVFIENRGQWDSRAKFLLRSPGLDLWITSNGVVYDLKRIEHSNEKNAASVLSIDKRAEMQKLRVTCKPVFMSFVGSSPTAEAQGLDRLEGYHNYFIGNDPTKWSTNVPLYGSARLDHIYEGIDAVFYLENNTPRYDLVIAPGADPAKVQMKFEGAESMKVDGDGSLVLHTELGDVRQRELFAYQMVDGRKQQVRCGFRVNGDGVVKFSVGSYDRAQPLVIDPVMMVYSTYLGGSGLDQGYGIAVDGSGNAYITGVTDSPDFPMLNPMQSSNAGNADVFVAKLTSADALSYSTYLGGSGFDQGYGIAVDGSGNAYVTGITKSMDFPTLNPSQSSFAGFQDAFVTKLTSNGAALIYSTYLGGSSSDDGRSIAVDGSGNACVTGYTQSSNFPILNPVQSSNAGPGYSDAFVTKLTSAGVLSYSTYLGGNDDDQGYGIAVDGSGNAYVTGSTRSTNFPTLNPAQSSNAGDYDAFVTKLTSTGALSYSTYLGGRSFPDQGTGIAVDGNGNAYVTGSTQSSNFPTTSGVAQSSFAGGYDAFITKLTSAGALSYSTYLGGPLLDQGTGIAVDGSGNAYVTGNTSLGNFPTLNPYQSSNAGGQDAFVTKLTSTGTLSYSTYLGGSFDDQGTGIAVDGNGNAYVTGYTLSTNFPTLNAVQSSNAGGYDAFVTKFTASQSGAVDAPNQSLAARLTLHDVQPNPITNNTMHLAFALQEPSSVTVELYSTDGRLLATLINVRHYEAGEHAEQVSVADLPTGAYLLRLRAGVQEQSERFVVER